MAVPTGELTNRLMIQEKIRTQSNESGSPKHEWRDVKWIWCSVQSIGSTEQQKATGQVEIRTVRVKAALMGNSWINASQRGLWLDCNGIILNFTGVRPDPSNDELIIECAGLK